jgi:hypothetical protein
MIHLYLSLILSGIIIVLLQSYIKLLGKYNDLKHEHDYMSEHLLDIYKGLCRVRKARMLASAPQRAKKAPTKPKPKVKPKTK